MKTLVLKEVRENVKLAALGLVIYTLLLAVQYRDYLASPTNMTQPLAGDSLLWSTVWFCGIFGAVLGWLQIHNERRPDLWAFLLHRPMTRTQIFLGKALAGMALYALVVGLPLLVFVAWALWPGHVAAPFEPAMLRPLATFIITGLLFYLAGMLTGLRQARWYGSRALALGMALIVCLLMQFRPEWWQGALMILIGGAILATAVWGGFQTHGYYRNQPLPGKVALTVALMLGSMIVAVVAALLLSNLFPKRERQESWSHYAMTEDGTAFKVTEGPAEASSIVDLEGKPLLDAKTGRKTELSEFNRSVVKPFPIHVPSEPPAPERFWTRVDTMRAWGQHPGSDTLWYYWRRYGRLVAYDVATRRCIGSLGPNGFAADLSGGGERFSDAEDTRGSRTICTATTLYRLDYDKRTAKPLFTSTSDDPILATSEIMAEGYDWEYTAVVTRQFVHWLTAEGKPVWKAPYKPVGSDTAHLEIYRLKPAGQFALWVEPSYLDSLRANWKLPTHVSWIAGGQGVIRSAELPGLPPSQNAPAPEELLVSVVAPPAVLLTLPWFETGIWQTGVPQRMLLLSWASAILVCLPVGLWLGRRYRLSLAAQAGWALFHVLFGVPGLLAFLGVQEWPARVPCPNCKRLRLVDRQQCEHCGAEFAPPEKTGTEVFAPLLAS